MWSKPWISCWFNGVPTLGKARCDCARATGATNISTGTSSLSEHCIGNAPILSDVPGLNGVHVNGAWPRLFVPIRRLHAPVLSQFGERRLNVAGLIRSARHQHRLFTVPRPVIGKAGVGFRMHRILDLRLLPGLAAVGRDVDLADLARAGPSEAGDLHIAFAHFHSG